MLQKRQPSEPGFLGITNLPSLAGRLPTERRGEQGFNRTKCRSFADQGLSAWLSGDVVDRDFPRKVEAARLDPRQFARTGSRKGPRWNKRNDRRDAGDGPNPVADFVVKPSPLFKIRHTAVNEYSGRFLTARAGNGEGGDVARLETGELLDRPFDILRPVV